MSDCTVCSRPAPDAYLCPGCIDVLATELRTVPWLVEQLDVTLTRQARMGDRNGPRATERPLVFDPAASVDLETLRDGLWMWALAVAQQRDITVEVHKEPVAVSKWLLRWMGAVAQHADAAELHGDITNMIRSARRTIDRPVDRRYIGPCEDCGSDLYVNDYGTGRLPTTVTCTRRLPLVEIDLNVRVRGNHTFVGLEDSDEPLKADQVVRVYERESAVSGFARVEEVDDTRKLAYLTVDWPEIRDYTAQRNAPPSKECGACYPMKERRAWLLESAYNQIRTPADISRALGELFEGKRVTPNMISQWAARGLRIEGSRRQLTPYLPDARDPHKRTRYSVEEVVTFYRAANGVGEKQGSAAA